MLARGLALAIWIGGFGCERTVSIGGDEPLATTTSAGSSAGTAVASSTSADLGVDACTLQSDDDACVVCLRTRCCDALLECSALDVMGSCECVLDCARAGTSPMQCPEQCEPAGSAAALVGCAAMSCLAVCP